MGKIIDAEFGGRNADDRYCAACDERFPRRSTLCPRCGGALVIWATHTAAKQRRAERSQKLRWTLSAFALFAAVVAALLALIR